MRQFLSKILFLLFLALNPSTSYAEEGPDIEAQKVNVLVTTKDKTNFIDDTKSAISRFIYFVSSNVDRTLSRKKGEYKGNNSRIVVSGVASNARGEKWEYVPLYNVNLNLPETESRLQIVVESKADEFVEANETTAEGKSSEEVLDRYQKENIETTAGLRYLLLSLKEWNSSANLGVGLDRNPELVAKAQARGNYNFRFGKILPSVGLIWRPSRGFRNQYGFNYEETFMENEWKFIYENKLEWQITNEQAEFITGPSLIHRITKRIAMTYIFKQHSLFEPTVRAERYEFSVKYRQDLYGGWVYGNITPFISYLRENNFGPYPGIVFRLDFVFAAKS